VRALKNLHIRTPDVDKLVPAGVPWIDKAGWARLVAPLLADRIVLP
jgi:hypothetical protein